MQNGVEYGVWKNKQSSLVKETISERMNATKNNGITQNTYSKPQLACGTRIDNVQH